MPKSSSFTVALRGYENISRFQVAVNNEMAVANCTAAQAWRNNSRRHRKG